MKKKTIIFSLIIGLSVILSLALLPSAPKSVQAQSSAGELRGWAWSSNIGWISFSSVDSGSTVPYSVSLQDDGNGGKNLSGYAWSSNIGWIRFEPSLTGVAGQGDNYGAKIDSSKNFKGWARACSVYVSGCAGTEKSVIGTELGGWDGWIKMTDSTYDSTAGKLLGYAWGALNVGWVDLANVSVVPSNCATSGQTPPPACCTGLTQCNGTGPCVDPSSCSNPPGCTLPGTPANNCCNNSGYYVCSNACVANGTSCGGGGCQSGYEDCNGVCVLIGSCGNHGCVAPNPFWCEDSNSCVIDQNACTPVIEKCTFTVASKPSRISVNVTDGNVEQISSVTSSLIVTPSNCDGNLNLISEGFPDGTSMVCSTNSGSTWNATSCSNLSNDDVYVGVSVLGNQVDPEQLSNGCKLVTIKNENTTVSTRKVCLYGDIGN